MNEMLYISETGLATAVKGGKIRKQILPRNKTFRWPNRPGMLLHLTDEILDQIIENFKQGVIDTVPFFKVTDSNAHTEDPERSRGNIVDLIKTDDGVDAIIEPIDSSTGKQILATQLGASAGIKFNYEDHATGESKGAVLRHVAWTPEPWISGMRPFEEVSLSGESYEAVFLSEDANEDPNNESDKGGETSMDPKELEAILSAAIEKALEPVNVELSNTRDALKTANDQISALTTTLNERQQTVNAKVVQTDVDEMVKAGLPPAIAELATPILMEGASEVHLSSGETKTVAEQVREILTLIPKVDFSEKGDSGPEGAVVVLSAEQVKNLGFKTEEKKKEGNGSELSAEQKADLEIIESVTALIPADKRKEA